MPKPGVIAVFYTERALQNAVVIKDYLNLNFSHKEIEHFMSLLKTFEIAVSAFPELYPASAIKRGVRRAVLNKPLSVFYRIKKQRIEILAILDNRCDLPKRIKSK
jgi:plasmid stabilization system protein ParE